MPRNRIRLFESLCAHNLAAHAPALSKEPSVRERISLTHRRWFTDKWCVDKSDLRTSLKNQFLSPVEVQQLGREQELVAGAGQIGF